MEPREKIERVFMAAQEKDEMGKLDGPFASAAEAEAQARKLGWHWVLVYAHVLNGKGEVIDITRRFYQPAFVDSPDRTPGNFGKALIRRTAQEIEPLRRELSTPDIPMSAEDKAFFAGYEREMETFNGKKR